MFSIGNPQHTCFWNVLSPVVQGSADHYCSFNIGLFLPSLNKVSESVPHVCICSCCRLPSKDSKDRLFLHMDYLIQCILKEVWLLYCSEEVGGRVWEIHTDSYSV